MGRKQLEEGKKPVGVVMMEKEKLCKEVIEHLEKDSKTWMEVANKAFEESASDDLLIEKLKKVI